METGRITQGPVTQSQGFSLFVCILYPALIDFSLERERTAVFEEVIVFVMYVELMGLKLGLFCVAGYTGGISRTRAAIPRVYSDETNCLSRFRD